MLHPAVLVDKIGIAKILQRVPTTYLKALFASRLAGHYVYKFTASTPTRSTSIDFLQEFRKK